MESFSVRRTRRSDFDGIASLSTLAGGEGWLFVARLLDEWESGANRFDAPGEALFVAASGTSVIGVCGVNVDPYADDPSVARLRHLFVHPAHRRCGVGSALVDSSVEHARGSFATLRLRTRNPDALAFYAALGFREIDDVTCTHLLSLR